MITAISITDYYSIVSWKATQILQHQVYIIYIIYKTHRYRYIYIYIYLYIILLHDSDWAEQSITLVILYISKANQHHNNNNHNQLHT